MRQALSLHIAGRVQGVGYRDWMAEEARSLGLDGWVRNLPDGTVEAVVAGAEDAVAAMIDSCRRGPRFARVATLDTAPAEDPDPGFHRLPTPR